MSFWYDIKNKNYSSDRRGSWLRAYADRIVSVLRSDCDTKFDEHFEGKLGRHKAADVDCDNGNTVQQNLDSERTERLAADAAIRTELAAESDEIRAEMQSGDNALSTEISNVNTALKQEIADEAVAREAAVEAEASARASAISSEASARATAISSEASARTTADTNLQSQINGKAPTSHASTATTYGVGTSSNYGHLKVADNLTTTTSGTALSANQGKQLKAQIDALPIWNVGGKSIETGWGYDDSSNIVTARTGATIIGHSNEDRLSTSLTYPGCAATGMYSVAIGGAATATGDNSVALGKSTASGYWAVAVSGGEASGGNSFASGTSIASGAYSTAMGYECTASSASSLAIGKWNNASGERSVALGYKNTALDFQFKIGQNAKQGTAGVEASTTGDAFIIGNGTSSLSNPSNAFRVTYSGSVYGTGAYNSSGADIAELYEWQDGNPDNEDRRGLFVTLDGTKIRLATPEDTYIKGVVSASPCLVGDSYSEDWQGKYLTDVFGEKLTQTVHYDAEYEDREIVDEETGEKTTERVMIHDEYDAVEWVINPDYDPEKEYIPREERPEYDYVSSWGKLVLVDDGSCEVNGFATVGEGGKATKSDTQTMYRVMERKDDTHIYVAVG